MQETPPWLIVMLSGVVSALFGALVAAYLRQIARGEKLFDTVVVKLEAVIVANTEAIRAATVGMLASAEQSKEQRTQVAQTTAAILAGQAAIKAALELMAERIAERRGGGR